MVSAVKEMGADQDEQMIIGVNGVGGRLKREPTEHTQQDCEAALKNLETTQHTHAGSQLVFV